MRIVVNNEVNGVSVDTVEADGTISNREYHPRDARRMPTDPRRIPG